MRRIIFGAIASVLLLAGTANATILVGTTESLPENKANINILIGLYNSDRTATLSLVDHKVDKLDKIGDSGGGEFEDSKFVFTDFQFYLEEENATHIEDFRVFNELLDFKEVILSGVQVEKPVHGFDQLDGPIFEYYVSKNSTGWSLWLAMDGFNPVYRDDISLSSPGDGLGVDTRGDIGDAFRFYDPIKNGVSHISFYSVLEDTSEEVIPEPATMAIWGMLTGFATLFGYRKRKLATVTA